MSTQRREPDPKHLMSTQRRELMRPNSAPNDGARRLREVLLRRTQRSVALTAKIGANTIGQYARGDRRPEPDNRAQLEIHFGIPPTSWDEPNVLREGMPVPDSDIAPNTIATPCEVSRGESKRESQVDLDDRPPDSATVHRAPLGGLDDYVVNVYASTIADGLFGPLRESLARHRAYADDPRALAIRIADDLMAPIVAVLTDEAEVAELEAFTRLMLARAKARGHA